jgi:hypothetical protein
MSWVGTQRVWRAEPDYRKAFVHYADEDGLSQLALRTTRNYNENRTAGPFLKARPLSIVSVYALESLLYLGVPEPPLDRGKRFVVTVLEVAGHERRIRIEHVLQSDRHGCVI